MVDGSVCPFYGDTAVSLSALETCRSASSAINTKWYRSDESCTMGATIVPQFRLLGGQASPANFDDQ